MPAELDGRTRRLDDVVLVEEYYMCRTEVRLRDSRQHFEEHPFCWRAFPCGDVGRSINTPGALRIVAERFTDASVVHRRRRLRGQRVRLAAQCLKLRRIKRASDDCEGPHLFFCSNQGSPLPRAIGFIACFIHQASATAWPKMSATNPSPNKGWSLKKNVMRAADPALRGGSLEDGASGLSYR